MMMQDIAMHILDIGMNSIKANADTVKITIQNDLITSKLTIVFEDNGCGMNEEEVINAQNPFYTSRSTRKVGLGIPFIKAAAEMSGGSFSINSKKNEGTVLKVEFKMILMCINL